MLSIERRGWDKRIGGLLLTNRSGSSIYLPEADE